jgi:CRP/FNR family transcriptional regulator, cyclic AMP receptor protein
VSQRIRMTPGGVVASAVGTGAAGSRRRPTRRRAAVPLLQGVPLFAHLSRRHLRRIAALADEVRFRDGRVIVEAGLPGTTFFVLAEGRAKVYRSKIPTGRPLARLGPGDFFGEMALLDGGPRSATVVADGDVVALRLSRSAFRKIVTREPSLSLAMMAELAARLRRGTATE